MSLLHRGHPMVVAPRTHHLGPCNMLPAQLPSACCTSGIEPGIHLADTCRSLYKRSSRSALFARDEGCAALRSPSGATIRHSAPVLLIGAEVLPGKLAVKGLPRVAGTRPQGAPLRVSFLGERMPGAWRTARPGARAARSSWLRNGGDRRPAGAGRCRPTVGQ